MHHSFVHLVRKNPEVLGDDEADAMLNKPHYRAPYVVPEEI